MMLTEAGLSISAEVENAFAAASRLSAIAESRRGAMDAFIGKDVFLARPGSRDTPGKRGNPTSAAFAACVLTDANAFDELKINDETIASRDKYADYLFQFSKDSILETKQESEGGASNGSETFYRLQNPYNSPIVLAGCASLLGEKYPNKESIPLAWAIGLAHLAQFVAKEALERSGYLPSLSPGDYEAEKENARRAAPPSYVFTYWAAASLQKYLQLDNKYKLARFAPADNPSLFQDALSAVGTWAERALAMQIAAHHAGARAVFDPGECLCCVATITLAQQVKRRSATTAALAEHALEIVLDHYFDKGLLTASRPFVVAGKTNRLVTSSSFETLCYLISALRIKDVWPRRPERLLAVVQDAVSHIEANWEAGVGVANDQDTRFGVVAKPTAFSTSAAKALLSHGEALAAKFADVEAKRILGVGEPVKISGKEPPLDPHLERIMSASIVGFVNSADPKKRSRGFYSMIWFGPPGTGKTTAAKTLAGRLGWPLLEITQKDFLVRGVDFIDACAERIFRLLLRTREVVVLFDELEELVQSREAKKSDAGSKPTNDQNSRLLTTSMLPRIHDLRDQMKVVFIFATNRIESFDAAATRLGRFDVIAGLPPPGPIARNAIYEKAMANSFSDVDKATEDKVRKILSAEGFPVRSRGAIAKDIQFVVSQIRNELALGGGQADESAIAKHARTRTITDEMLKGFKKLVEDESRPPAKYEIE